MFKIEGLNLPTEVKKDNETSKNGKNGKNGGKNGANSAGQKRPNLTQMFSELEEKEKAPKPKRKRGKHASKASIESADDLQLQEAVAAKAEQTKEKQNQPKPNQQKPKQNLKKQVKKSEQKQNAPEQKQAPEQAPEQKQEETSLVMNKKKVTLTPLQQKMQQKLSGARFRWINELLYTSESQKAVEVFETQPEVFNEYHEGFRHQVDSWPENPVDSFVEQFEERLKKHLNAPGGLPATKHLNQVVVADMGCGEAQLALKLSEIKHPKARFEVHSFDLHKANNRITVADIAHVPLPDSSCHVVVFCLALMGTNLNDFIKEGIRILKDNGIVWIAEIKSRFEDNKYDDFIEKLKSLGLYHKTTDDSNKMFVKFEFLKLPHRMARAKASDADIHLKPCIYKRR